MKMRPISKGTINTVDESLCHAVNYFEQGSRVV